MIFLDGNGKAITPGDTIVYHSEAHGMLRAKVRKLVWWKDDYTGKIRTGAHVEARGEQLRYGNYRILLRKLSAVMVVPNEE